MRKLQIKVTTNCEVIVNAPYGITQRTCDSFVQEHFEWINNALNKAKERLNEIKSELELQADKILYLGKEYEHQFDKTLKLKYSISENIITTKSNDKSSFYKHEARKIFEAKCSEIAPFYGVRYTKLRVASQKSRWGSCSSSGTISLNYNLIKAPHGIIEYVIIHELCHLLHHNHSDKFWDSVAILCPDYKSKRVWLKNNGWRLTI